MAHHHHSHPTVQLQLGKMQAQLDTPIHYTIVDKQQSLMLNPYLGQFIQLGFTGKIHCIQCQRDIKKSFQQGYCYPCFQRLQECQCMLTPERCRFPHGKCDPNDWAHAQCGVQHVVYLANTSQLKIGVTRVSHMPSRWIDQGATQALPIFRVENRYQVGQIEVALKALFSDTTNWRTMLSGAGEAIDLLRVRDDLFTESDKLIKQASAAFSSDLTYLTNSTVTHLNYPIEDYPQKITSLSFDKTRTITGKLQGIKGQYLLLDIGVLNIRKFSGYEITFRLFDGCC